MQNKMALGSKRHPFAENSFYFKQQSSCNIISCRITNIKINERRRCIRGLI